jgi:hypothetical protein
MESAKYKRLIFNKNILPGGTMLKNGHQLQQLRKPFVSKALRRWGAVQHHPTTYLLPHPGPLQRRGS